MPTSRWAAVGVGSLVVIGAFALFRREATVDAPGTREARDHDAHEPNGDRDTVQRLRRENLRLAAALERSRSELTAARNELRERAEPSPRPGPAAQMVEYLRRQDAAEPSPTWEKELVLAYTATRREELERRWDRFAGHALPDDPGEFDALAAQVLAVTDPDRTDREIAELLESLTPAVERVASLRSGTSTDTAPAPLAEAARRELAETLAARLRASELSRLPAYLRPNDPAPK